MRTYYFNNNVDSNGRHEVHAEDCSWLPSISNRTRIGYCNSCKEAIQKAQLEHPSESFDGCYHCCKSCHRG